MKKYYSEKAQSDQAEHGADDQAEQGQRQWAELIGEVDAAIGEDPGCEKAQGLAARWSNLISASGVSTIQSLLARTVIAKMRLAAAARAIAIPENTTHPLVRSAAR